MIVQAQRTIIFLIIILLLNTCLIQAACRDVNLTYRLPNFAHAANADAIIGYFGHNFFQITTKKGTKIITDPLGPGWYPDPNLFADIVTIGREHFNHNYVEIVRGNPIILRGLTDYGEEWNQVSMNFLDVLIYNVPIYQSSNNGSYLKGAAFVFDLGKLCIAHLGDLSHPLTPKQIKQMKNIDIALIPIGGRYTMGPDTARKVLGQLKPKIAIPMHYRDNDYVVKKFTRGFKVRKTRNNILTVSKSSLPSPTEIVVLRPTSAMGYE